MSSVRSPDLRLDLATDWRVVAAILAWIGVCIGAAWQAELSAGAATLITLALLGLGFSALGSQLFGVNPRLPVGLGWNSDGQWHAQGRDGAREELELSAGGRVFPAGALLVFRKKGRSRWFLLLSPPGGSPALRRLRVRLNLDYNPARNNLNQFSVGGRVRSSKVVMVHESAHWGECRINRGRDLRELSPKGLVSGGAQSGSRTAVASPDGH